MVEFNLNLSLLGKLRFRRPFRTTKATTMSKQFFNKMWAILPMIFLSFCLSANMPPHILKLQAELDSKTGVDRIKFLRKIANAISAYDYDQGMKYFDESIHLASSTEGLSKYERTYQVLKNYETRNYKYLYKYKFFEAFKGSIEVDSIANLLEGAPDSLNDARWLGHLNANTVRNAVFADQNLYSRSERELKVGLEHCKKLTKQKSRIGSVYSNLGINLMLQNKYDESEVAMLKADSVFTASESERDIAFCKMFQTDLYAKKEDWKKAKAVVDEAIVLIRKYFPSRIPMMQAQAAWIYYENDLVVKSDSFVVEAFKYLEQVKEPGASIWTKSYIGHLYKRQNKFEEAFELLDEKTVEDMDTDNKMAVPELLALQEAYIQNNFPTDSKNENYPLWIFFALVPIVGIVFQFLYKERQPRVIIESVPAEGQKLEIAWKQDESKKVMADPFVERFVLKVQKSMDDGDVSVDKIAEEMRISRVQLFRKVKAATGESPSVLIRQIRLKTAERLLVENTGNISEVAYRVGFSNPNSFSRAFKDHFGSSPKEYLLKMHG